MFHDAYAVMLEKQNRGQLDPEQMRDGELRAYLTQTAIHKALDEGKRAERRMTTTLDDTAAALPDADRRPEERVAASMAAAPLREIVAELPARQQAIVKLRFFHDRSPGEIQALLGMTERTYRRQLERAMRKVAETYALVESGAWCESRRSLIAEFVAGTADPGRARLARAHLRECPGCARIAAELREATRSATALLPLPALLSDGILARVGDLTAPVRNAVSEIVLRVERELGALLGRLDPSTAHYATARPGNVAATISACLAIGGGGAYCAIEGVPDPWRALAGGRGEASAEQEPEPRPAPKTTAHPTSAPEPRVRAPVERNPAPPEERPQSKPQPEPEITGRDPTPQAEPQPAPSPASEFSPEATAPSSAPPPPSTSPSAPGGGEFDF